MFVKWIKQHLRVKTFYGTSANAVKTQIWVAMIVYLLLAILKERYRLEQTLSQLLHFLEVNIFEQTSMLSISPMPEIVKDTEVKNLYHKILSENPEYEYSTRVKSGSFQAELSGKLFEYEKHVPHLIPRFGGGFGW